MKKVRIAALIVVLVLGVAAQTFAGGGKQETGEPGREKIIVGYFAMNTVDTFHFPINAKAKEILDGLKANGTIDDWHLYDGKDDPVNQVSMMDTALDAGCNYFILLPVEAAGSAPVVAKAKERGKHIIVVNSKTTNTDDLADGYVGSNDVQAGEMMAQWVQQQYPNGGLYGHITGPVGNSAAIERGAGVHNIMDRDSRWRMVDEQAGNWQAEQATRYAEDWNNKYKNDLKAIICDNDDMSVGVRNVMNGAGRRDMAVIGVDGNANALNMIKTGDLDASIYQDGIGQVTKGLELLVDLMNGKTIPKTTMIEFVTITKSNINQYLK
ncbi:MAG: substrate-binding domain-containing protein [Spirochaetaceae bacterium]|jgi:ABC-type sugar transport system substrate-binding protein|nr:substrate-binding domain-containing protein [Spirochaetaceae bacterium]